MTHTLLTTGYFIYLPIVLVLTWFTAHTLFTNGKVFMLDIFHQKIEIAMSTNKLFEVGFYLINVGFALLIMQMAAPKDTTDLVEHLATKLGGFAIYLGIMLFANLYMFFRGRRASKRNMMPTAE
jgi:hypothetical protein